MVTEQMSKLGFDGCPIIEFEDSDFRLVVSLLPKKPSSRISESRLIGMYPYQSVFGGSETSIKESIYKKSKRYGELDKPYIICINAIGIKGSANFDVNNALWGSLALSFSTNPNDRNERWERQFDGVFLGEKGPKIRNVSGVFITKVMEANIHVAEHWFVKHPFTKREIDFNIFDLTYYFVSNGKIEKESRKAIGEILKVKDTWLED